MRNIKLGLMLLCASVPLWCEAATVYGTIRRADAMVPGARVRWERLGLPTVLEDESTVNLESFESVMVRGSFTNEVYAGDYRVRFGTGVQEVWTLHVPTGTNAYNFWELATNTVSFVTNLAGAPVTGATNIAGPGVALFKTNNQGKLEFLRLKAGTGVTLSSQGNTQVVVTATGGGGGGGTTLAMQTNGVQVDAAVTTLNVTAGTQTTVQASTDGSGTVTLQVDMSGAWSTALSNLCYAIGLNGTNYTDSRAVALSNLSYAIGTAATNYADGRAVALSNLSYAIGTAATNYTDARAVALSNLSYAIGANGTNYTDSRAGALSNLSYTIGLAATNYANGLSVAASNLSYAIGTAATNYTDSRAVALSNLSYAIGANGTNYTDSRAVALSNLSYAIGTAGTNYTDARSVALSNLSYAIGTAGTNYTDKRQGGSAVLTNLVNNPVTDYTNRFIPGSGVTLTTNAGTVTIASTGGYTAPTLVTNTVWVDAGAMRAYLGSTAEGGRSSPSAGAFTNGAYVADTWDFDDTTNECAMFSMAMGPAFAGIAKVHLHWMTTNTLNGLSNVVWEAAAGVLATNNTLASYLYATNGTMRFWSSNSLQITTLPTLTLTNYLPRNRIEWRIGRLGTNSNDEALGDVRLLGAEIAIVSTNYMGGF